MNNEFTEDIQVGTYGWLSVAGIPDAIESARGRYSTASVKNEELPSSWIKDKASRRKSEETVSFRIALAITSNSNRRESVIKCHIFPAQCQITRITNNSDILPIKVENLILVKTSPGLDMPMVYIS
ncbi:hypothetical protein B0H13DRAFT_1850638 [Mycena leptocephala]|nr:hypothetical protein B0H13DRAFT_1850638 [Mycena leptocephala]